VNDAVEAVKFPVGPKDDFVDELVPSSESETKSTKDYHCMLSKFLLTT
jgi:hypothetical protein